MARKGTVRESKGSKSGMTAQEILTRMNESSMNPSVSRVTVGKTVVYTR